MANLGPIGYHHAANATPLAKLGQPGVAGAASSEIELSGVGYGTHAATAAVIGGAAGEIALSGIGYGTQAV